MTDILVMFSGGKDSFLTACRLVKDGYRVHLLSFNNGKVFGESGVRHSAQRLINRFGNRVVFEGMYLTVAALRQMEYNFMRSTAQQFSESYGQVTFTQLRCVHCQTSMWICAIAYCAAKGIHEIACGYRKDDEFCTGCEVYQQHMLYFAERFGVITRFPVLDSYTDEERDTEMVDFSFLPKVAEPKCVEGMPAVHKLEGVEEDQLLNYLRRSIFPQMENEIKKYIPIFKNIKLTDTAIEEVNWPISNGEDGLY